jgi:hypothetical protein
VTAPIPDFDAVERALVAKLVHHRHGKPPAIELADSELRLDPAGDELTVCPTLYWTERGALAFSEPEKSQKQIRDIVEAAYDHGADMIVKPCPLCQANVEVYQAEINAKQGTKLAMPVTYYSRLMTVAYGGTAKQAGLDGHLIAPTELQEIAAKPATK